MRTGISWKPLEELPATFLSSLIIDKCDNFSTNPLKELVCLRNESFLAETVDNDDNDKSAIEYLHVTVRSGGPIIRMIFIKVRFATFVNESPVD